MAEASRMLVAGDGVTLLWLVTKRSAALIEATCRHEGDYFCFPVLWCKSQGRSLL